MIKRNLLILWLVLLILFPLVNGYNIILQNFTTTKTSYYSNETVIFKAYYFNYGNESVRFVISNTSTFNNCNYSVQSGCFAYSSLTNSNPIIINKNITSVGNYSFYAKICDAYACASNQTVLDFHNITNPTELHKAEENCSSNIFDDTIMYYGDEATNESYTNLSEDDSNVWNSNYCSLKRTFHKFIFNLTIKDYNNSINISYKGGDSSTYHGLYLYAWNYSSLKWILKGTKSTPSLSYVRFSLDSNFINDSLVKILALTNISGAGNTRIESDYISLKLILNNSLTIEIQNATNVTTPSTNITNRLTIRYNSPTTFDDYSETEKISYAERNGVLVGLAFDTLQEVNTSATSSILEISSNYTSTSYIMFTFPSKKMIKDKTQELGKGNIIASSWPNFGISKDEEDNKMMSDIEFILKYPNIIFHTNRNKLPPGNYNIKFINNGTINGTTNIIINIIK